MFHNEQGPYWGTTYLEQDQCPVEDRFKDLEKRALAGNQFACDAVINATCQGLMGQNREHIAHNLLFWIAQGDQKAMSSFSCYLTKPERNHLQHVPALYSFLGLLYSPE